MPKYDPITDEERKRYNRYLWQLKGSGIEPKPLEEWLRIQHSKKLSPPTYPSTVAAKRPTPRPAVSRVACKPGRVQCGACGHEQADEGMRKSCGRCGFQPVPSRQYPKTSVFYTH